MFILANLFPLLLQHHAELVIEFAKLQEKYSRTDSERTDSSFLKVVLHYITEIKGDIS